MGETFCRPTSSLTSRRARIPTRACPSSDRRHPARWPAPGRRRTSRRSLRRRPTTTVRLHRSRHGCRPGTRRSHPRCHTRRPFRRRHHRKAPGLRPGRRLAPNRRPAVRPTPSMTNSAEPSRTRPAALVSSRPG
ncbi:MCE-family protein mce4F [Mycobacterium tuberculosis T17]|nr:MCE-family protein mce4F [Mycobacterium tuberculosis T17]